MCSLSLTTLFTGSSSQSQRKGKKGAFLHEVAVLPNWSSSYLSRGLSSSWDMGHQSTSRAAATQEKLPRVVTTTDSLRADDDDVHCVGNGRELELVWRMIMGTTTRHEDGYWCTALVVS